MPPDPSSMFEESWFAFWTCVVFLLRECSKPLVSWMLLSGSLDVDILFLQ